ncbi:Autophagy-related protein 18 [Cryomyces minteri]|uniref:Autophagy-related protein 18 n=1 Tax=Cryomyces minteri TaxID=331657 RepID=A0A4U0X031_9PEZI|nr:Autophagy-related protein 18 [Cryomyces minteri]
MALNFVTFNQDHSLLAVGTTKGFRIYYTDPFSKSYESRDDDVAILEMLFSTSLVALTTKPRVLLIRNTKRQSTICDLTFPTMVLAVRLNRKRLVVVLEDQIYIYDVSNMKLLHTLDTVSNPYAICALSPSSEHNYLAYPLQKKVAPPSGDVLLFDATKLEAVNVVAAHQAPLSCIALNSEGTLLATASEKGTIIRVFSVPDAQKLYQFRRGSMPSRIYSMSFNATSTLLCVSSASETIHVFRLAPQMSASKIAGSRGIPISPQGRSFSGSRDRSISPNREDLEDSTNLPESADLGARQQARNPTFMSMVRRTSQNVGANLVTRAAGYLPSAVSEIWEPARDFAWVKIPRTAGAPSVKTVVAMSSNIPQVMVASSEGQFYVFNIDLEKGGEGTLTHQHS